MDLVDVLKWMENELRAYINGSWQTQGPAAAAKDGSPCLENSSST
jgi:hypothetical protein